MMIWAVLFLVYIIIFGIRLQKWDYDIPAHCYRTTYTALPKASHPYVDHIYISVTCLFIAISFTYAISLSFGPQAQMLQKLWSDQIILKLQLITGSVRNRPQLSSTINALANAPLPEIMAALGFQATDLQSFLLQIAMLQCPLHIYSIFALRASNEGYLENGSLEKEWGFGQTAAVISLGGNILQFVDGIAGMIPRKSVLKAKLNRDNWMTEYMNSKPICDAPIINAEQPVLNPVNVQGAKEDVILAVAPVAEEQNIGSEIN
jgi:hypothetical protein